MCVYIKMFFMAECRRAFAWSTSQCIFDCWFKYMVCNKLFLVCIDFFLYWNNIPSLAGFCCLCCGHSWTLETLRCVLVLFSPCAPRGGSCSPQELCGWTDITAGVCATGQCCEPPTAPPSWCLVEYLVFLLSLLLSTDSWLVFRVIHGWGSTSSNGDLSSPFPAWEHRMVWVGRFKDYLVPIPCHVQPPTRPGSSELCQTWPWTLPGMSIHNFSGQAQNLPINCLL